jgi:hypothetical protein
MRPILAFRHSHECLKQLVSQHVAVRSSTLSSMTISSRVPGQILYRKEWIQTKSCQAQRSSRASTAHQDSVAKQRQKSKCSIVAVPHTITGRVPGMYLPKHTVRLVHEGGEQGTKKICRRTEASASQETGEERHLTNAIHSLHTSAA